MLRKIWYLFHNLFINCNFKKIRVTLSAKIKSKKSFEGYNKVGSKTYITGKVGFGSYIGSNCIIEGNVGRFCSISPNVLVITGRHPTNYVSTSPSFFSKAKPNYLSLFNANISESYGDVSIGNDVWIGNNVLIKGGVSIGDGAIIAMGSVVVNDIPPYSIVGGNPAKVIKMRFSNEIIDGLLKSQWWNNDLEKLKEKAHLFTDPSNFLSRGLENE